MKMLFDLAFLKANESSLRLILLLCRV